MELGLQDRMLDFWDSEKIVDQRDKLIHYVFSVLLSADSLKSTSTVHKFLQENVQSWEQKLFS